MAKSYEGKLGSLELTVAGEEKIQDLLTLSNYIMYSAKISELNGNIDTQEKSFIAMCKNIRNKPHQWTFIENRILGQVENYIENGKYTIDENDICMGSLKYLMALYDNTKDMTYVQKQRVEKDMKKIEKVIEETFAMEELKFSSKNSNFKQSYVLPKQDRKISSDNEFSRSKINGTRKQKRYREIKKVDEEDIMEYLHR